MIDLSVLQSLLLSYAVLLFFILHRHRCCVDGWACESLVSGLRVDVASIFVRFSVVFVVAMLRDYIHRARCGGLLLTCAGVRAAASVRWEVRAVRAVRAVRGVVPLAWVVVAGV